MRTAPHCVFRHLLGTTHLFHPPIEISKMGVEHLVPPAPAVIEQNRDLFERHPGGFTALDNGDAHNLILAVSSTPRSIAFGPQQPDCLPVPEHIGGQIEPFGDFPDRPWMRLA